MRVEFVQVFLATGQRLEVTQDFPWVKPGAVKVTLKEHAEDYGGH